jgi:hypothetical protein
MSLTKVTYSMIASAPINVADYSGLATTVTAKSPSDAASHLFTSFLSWNIPIQTAIDAAFDNGGGTVILPKGTVPYYLDDTIEIKENVTFVCEDELILADYTTDGHSILVNSDNVKIQGLALNNSGLYAGGSGQNGIAITGGKNIFITESTIKNCYSGNNNNGTGDGGKGVQIETGSAENVSVDNCSFTNCFIAMSSRRDGVNTNPNKGILFNNIFADNCYILLLATQANLHDETGQEVSVQLNNFYAVDCGAFEGVMQFSRASNVIVTNGIIAIDPLLSPTSLIRGNHNNCTFSDIHWYGNTDSMINLDPSTYAVDSSYAVKNNVYNVNILGTINYIADVAITTTNRTLVSCSGNITLANDVTAFFNAELRNGYSTFQVQNGTKSATINTNVNYVLAPQPYNFSQLSAGYNLATTRVLSATLTATGMTTSPTGTLYYSKVGNLVTLTIPTISGTSNSTAMTLTGLPAALIPSVQQLCLIRTTDNGTRSVGLIVFNTDGTVVLYASINASSFTASGTKAVDGSTVSYIV